MQVTDIIAQMGGIDAVARELGVDESTAAMGAAALLPAILGGFKKQTRAQPAGLDGLGGMLDAFGGGGLLDDLLGPQPTRAGRGIDVLGEIFGSKDVSRSVAQHAAGQSGLDPALLKRMLPLLAMLVAGYMSKRTGGHPGLASAAGKGRLGSGAPGTTGGGVGGTAHPDLASMLDINGNGNPLDDILSMAGQLLR